MPDMAHAARTAPLRHVVPSSGKKQDAQEVPDQHPYLPQLLAHGAVLHRCRPAGVAPTLLFIVGVLAPSSAGDITWMPPQLGREVYEAVDLRVTVDPDGGMRAEARVDEATIRVSREAERYARAIREAERRLEGRAHEDPLRSVRRTWSGRSSCGCGGSSRRPSLPTR
jgi:hypothetical protein